jgi:hypothetical protein
MAVIPRFLLTFGASLLSARAGMRLRRKRRDEDLQNEAYAELVPKLARASVWKSAGIEPGMEYKTFRRKLPLQTYETLSHHIERMKKGVAGVLWPGKCQIYCLTSGTSSGTPKSIPVTEAMLDHFRHASLDSMLWYTARAGHVGVFRGRHLYVGGSTAMAAIAGSAPFEAYAGDLSAITALNLPGWMEKRFYEPGAEIAEMSDWREKIAAITHRTARINITLLSGMPNWVLPLADSLRASSSHGKVRIPYLQAIWPNFECYAHGGVPIAPFQDELREALGPSVNFHEVYPAAEGFLAAQDADASAGLRLMTGAGIFFEFLPMAEYDESKLSTLGTSTVPLAEVEAGVDYALVLTTPAGLVRYVIGDVVRFLSTQPPRIAYVGRTGLRLNAFGERVIEKELTDALIFVCRRNGWTIVNFHIAPFYTDINHTTGRARGRHEWWIELKPGTLTTPTGPLMATELDTELQHLNEGYGTRRADGVIDAPFVRLVMPGVFEHWMRFHGQWGGQNKMPRCRSDRVIADELNHALQFAKD